jgi:hypothetical protein
MTLIGATGASGLNGLPGQDGSTGATGQNGQNGIVKIAYAGSGSKATGGTINYDSGSNYTFHTFTSSSTFTIN